jgi:TonB family protein
MFLMLSIALEVAATAPSGGVTAPVARAPLQNFITADDYPQAVPRSAARQVGVTLEVGADGRVTGCTITASSGNTSLDSTTCRLLRSRARFEPARAAGGAVTTGEVQAAIDWPSTLSLSATPPQVRQQVASLLAVPQAPWESISRLRVRLGQIGSCQWQNTGPVPPPPSSNACQNPGLAVLALGLAAENKVDFNKSEVVITLRMPGGGMIEPLRAAPAALIDLAAELEIGADGTLTNCRFTREVVRTRTQQRPDCRVIFNGPYSRATTSRGGEPVATKRQAELRVEAR